MTAHGAEPPNDILRAHAPRIVVAVCTYRRNDPLRRLLMSIERNAAELGDRAEVGVVVVDDNPDGSASAVCDEFADSFALGLHYRTSGEGSISVARNMALEAALPLSDWVAMTDDDCEPVDSWLASYVDVAERFDPGAVTGPCYLQPASGAPNWLVDQPFLEDFQFRGELGQPMEVGATNNSFLRSSFFRERPQLRFVLELGKVGGEDMVFFRSAVKDGLSIVFAPDAAVRGHEPVERCTLRYQLRLHYWIGNSEWVTNRYLGQANRPWWVLRACKAYVLAAARPARQVVCGRPPQFRYALAAGARATGMLVGALGHRVDHH